MDSFGKKYIFLNVFFLLLGTDIVLSDKSCNCESLSQLTKFVQQEIFQMKFDIIKLRSEFSSVSDGRNVVTQTSAGPSAIIDVAGLEKDKPTPAVEQRLDDLEKQLQAKLQSGFEELEKRTNETFRINAERNTFFKQKMTSALKKEKRERVNFISGMQSLIEDHKGAFAEFRTNISENFEDFKNILTTRLEEHVLKIEQDLASQRNDSELFENKISNELDRFEAKVSGDIETAGNRTALSILGMLKTLTNSTENINECIADIGSIKNFINDITSDTEKDRKALTELRNKFDDNVAKLDGIYSFFARKHKDCKDILRTTPDAKSGQYTIFLKESNKALSVYCDMETDGGGWTVFQRRYNGETDFFRNYSEYENGFGTVSGEFWLGLKNIQELASQGVTELRLDMTTFEGTDGNEIYQDFKLLDPEYTLQLGPFAANNIIKRRFLSMSYNNGSGFSTYDHDVDTDLSYNCASYNKGGWWYKERNWFWCDFVHLNSVYSTSQPCMFHYAVAGADCLKSTSMMLRLTT